MIKFGKNKGLVSAFIACGVLTVGFGVLIYFAHSKVSEEQEEIQGKKNQLKAAKTKLAEIPSLENRVIVLRENVKEYLKILPDSKEVNDFVSRLHGFQNESGVQITELRDKSRIGRGASGAQSGEGFEKVIYSLRLSGTTWKFLKFLHRLESFERFIRVPKLKISAGKRGKDQDPTKIEHKFNLDLETYVFNASGVVKPANIPDYRRKVLEMRNEIIRDRGKIAVESYEYHGPRGRRDPFVDPRVVASKAEGGTIALEQQTELVDELRAEVVRIGQMVRDYDQTKQMVQRFELRRQIEQSIEVLMEKIQEIEREGRVTYLPLVRRLQREVVDSLTELRSRFDAGGLRELGPSQDELLEIAERIKGHLGEGEFALAIDRYNLIADRMSSVEDDPNRRPLVEKLRRYHNQALQALEFEKIALDVGGKVVSPEGSVVVINGRSFGEGDYINDELLVRKIHADSIVFQYKDIVISMKN